MMYMLYYSDIIYFLFHAIKYMQKKYFSLIKGHLLNNFFQHCLSQTLMENGSLIFNH